jgi:hypothetical protein
VRGGRAPRDRGGATLATLAALAALVVARRRDITAP